MNQLSNPRHGAPRRSGSPTVAYPLLRFIVGLAFWVILLGVPLTAVLLATGVGSRTLDVEVNVHEPSWRLASAPPGGPAPELQELRGQLVFDGAGVGVGWPTWLGMGLAYLVALAIAKTARDIVATLDDEPFTPQNGARIARIGWILLAYLLLRPLAPFFVASELGRAVVAQGVTLAPRAIHIDLVDFAYPLLFLVLAQVFRRGTSLEAEQELTV